MTKTEREDLLDNKNVRGTLRMIQMGGEEGLGAFEIALIEISNAILHLQREKIEESIARAEEQREIDKRVAYRAIAKTALRTGRVPPPRLLQRILKNEEGGGLQLTIPGLERAESGNTVEAAPSAGTGEYRTIKIPEYKRADGTVVAEHLRRILGGDSEEANRSRAEAAAELEQVREYQRQEAIREDPLSQMFGEGGSGTAWRRLDSIDTNISQAIEFVQERPLVDGAVREFLDASDVGQGILAATSFLSRSTNTLQFAAKAIFEFGPRVGIQMARSYFRYGGYDLPMQAQGDQVVTELGDILPPPGDVDKTRNALVGALVKRLPGASAERAGTEPPSEGFIIDRNGNVLAHGVGRGDDNYVPFNSAHLRKARATDGVELVRRRMYGGPTTEDLKIAMMVGASRVTVVSNSGLMSFEVSPRAHGIKMEHMQILNAYQEHLDRFQENRERAVEIMESNRHVQHAHNRLAVPPNSSLNFNAYAAALSALSAEFPLHISSVQANVQNETWAAKHDRIQPRESLFRSLLEGIGSILGMDTSFGYEVPVSTESEAPRSETTSTTPESRSESAPSSAPGGAWSWSQTPSSTTRATPVRPPDESLKPSSERRGPLLPGRQENETVQEYYSRLVRQSGTDAAVSTLRNFYNQPGNNMPNWFKEIVEAPSAQPSRVAPVETRQADPARLAADEVEQRQQPERISFDDLDTSARSRIDSTLTEFGLNPGSVNRRKGAALRRISSAAQTPESWEAFIDSDDGIELISEAFPFEP